MDKRDWGLLKTMLKRWANASADTPDDYVVASEKQERSGICNRAFDALGINLEFVEMESMRLV